MNNPSCINPSEVSDVECFELIRQGKWCNANVYRFEKSNRVLVRKGFCFRSFLIRWSIGVFLTRRETRALQKLSGVSGIPCEVKRCYAYCLHYRYMDGETLGSISNQQRKLPVSYFIEAEKLLAEMHGRKIVHLDLRRGDNWIVRSCGKPGIIDFQSAIPVALLPRNLQQKLCDIDYSGLYKFWDRLCDEPLDLERQALLDRVNRVRKFWVFKGYAFQKFKSKRVAG
jgi:hypothetical protein